MFFFFKLNPIAEINFKQSKRGQESRRTGGSPAHHCERSGVVVPFVVRRN
jgi:hypothetical protein